MQRLDGYSTRIFNLLWQIHRCHAKSPLLMRSPPGLGTGSYGAALMGLSTGNIEEEDIDDGGPGGNKMVEGFGKLLAQVAVGHHDDPQTVKGSGYEVFLSEPLLPNLDEHL